MRLATLSVRNFRTIETLDLAFPGAYTAICGANDSGKTNVVRAIRTLMREVDYPYFVLDEEVVSPKDDFPKWLAKPAGERQTTVALTLSIDRERDAGLHQFCTRQLQLEAPPAALELGISVTYGSDASTRTVTVQALGNEYSGLEAQEVLKRLRTSGTILFHNSTQIEPLFRYRGGFGQLSELTAEAAETIDELKKTTDKRLKKIAKSQQDEFERLLGRLEKKYKVGISLPQFDLSQMPFNLALGETKFNVSLDNWGSGTQNRTTILMALFRAKQIGDASVSASKVTPLLIIEEPESFLHPSAQAEFGRVLQDLAEEFGVQVIVTSHSPYMLSTRAPERNILLTRRSAYGQPRETQRAATDGEHWMEPFGEALGLRSEEFQPWRQLFAADGKAILLVEGDIDREYFELLRAAAHGANGLRFDGDIVAYDGVGNLQNAVLLRFIKNRFKKLFVTFDLDAQAQLNKPLDALRFEEGKHYLPIGHAAAGKRCIEGLLPDSIHAAVYSANPGIVQAVSLGTADEQKKAKASLKSLCLAEFKAKAQPGEEYYKGLYAIAKIINRALGA